MLECRRIELFMIELAIVPNMIIGKPKSSTSRTNNFASFSLLRLQFFVFFRLQK